MEKPRIGFIGQGWIGKNYADNFEERGYDVVRYSREKPHSVNKDKIKDCDIVFIAVPTPTTPDGFDDSIVDEVIGLVGWHKTAVIKSTVLPGTTEKLQKRHQDVFVMHSPEFLTEATAAHDAANPQRNIVGIPVDSDVWRRKAAEVLEVLPYAPYGLVCSSRDAAFVKYGGNCWFYMKVVFMNMLYDLAKKSGGNWETIRDAMAADERIGRSHLDPVHKSGRGAGGHCFVKDFEAFRRIYKDIVGDQLGSNLLRNVAEKNLKYLGESKKDRDIVIGVYGESFSDLAYEKR